MNNKYKLILITIAYITLSSNKLFAQAGILDNTFSTDGKVMTQIGAGYDEAQAVAVQSDGKIVVIGTTDEGTNTYNDFALIRYNADGSLDNTFSGDGKVTTAISADYDDAYALAIQPNGKIIVGGSTINGPKVNFALVRYNSDGTLDNTFDTDGIAITPISSGIDVIYDIALQSNGKIVVTGTADNDFVVARYNTNGSLDLTFNSQGWVKTDFNGGGDEAYGIALQTDGKIVIGGLVNISGQGNFGVARYDSTGILDMTFSGDGKADTYIGLNGSAANDLAIQADGKILLAGYMNNGTNSDFALVRFKANGTLDSTFNGNGKLSHAILSSDEEAYAISLQTDNKILAAGYTTKTTGYGFALVRYNSDGSFDNTFGYSGKVTTSIGGTDDEAMAMAIQSNGKIILAGYGEDGSNDYGMAASRYNVAASTTIAQTKVNHSGISLYPNPADDFIQLNYALTQTENVNVQLFDIQGKQVIPASENILNTPGLHSLTIDLKGINSGIYNMVVMVGTEQQSFRIVVN